LAAGLGLFIGLLIVSGVAVLTQPRWLFSVATRIMPGALYSVTLPEDAPPTIALTIDDGPSSATADILAVLARYDAKATFFNISDRLPGHEETIIQSLAAGHELGNHLTADEPSIRLSPVDFERSLLTAQAVWTPYLHQTAPKHPSQPATLRWLRPGMGFYNSAMVNTAKRHGYQLVLGSVFPYDTHVPSVQFANAFILRNVNPGDIIVLHDGEALDPPQQISRGQRTVITLEKILPVLKARGYKITTVSELLSAAEASLSF